MPKRTLNLLHKRKPRQRVGGVGARRSSKHRENFVRHHQIATIARQSIKAENGDKISDSRMNEIHKSEMAQRESNAQTTSFHFLFDFDSVHAENFSAHWFFGTATDYF